MGCFLLNHCQYFNMIPHFVPIYRDDGVNSVSLCHNRLKTWSFVVKRKQASHNIADGRLLTQGIKWRFYVIWLQAAISDSRCIFEDNLGNES